MISEPHLGICAGSHILKCNVTGGKIHMLEDWDTISSFCHTSLCLHALNQHLLTGGGRERTSKVEGDSTKRKHHDCKRNQLLSCAKVPWFCRILLHCCSFWKQKKKASARTLWSNKRSLETRSMQGERETKMWEILLEHYIGSIWWSEDLQDLREL